MSILEELIEYSERCLDGREISCKKHKWACQRFLRDIKRMEEGSFRYIWNEEAAQNIVDWFSMLRHSKGVLAGKPIILTAWQKFRLCQLYGWKDRETGYKRFRKTFTEVARKKCKISGRGGSFVV